MQLNSGLTVYLSGFSEIVSNFTYTNFFFLVGLTAKLYENIRTKSDRKTGRKATENENLGFRTVAFPFAAPKSWGTKAKPGQNRAFQKPALCENFRIGSLLCRL